MFKQTLSWIVLARFSYLQNLAILSIFMIETSMAFINVIGEAIIVEMNRDVSSEVHFSKEIRKRTLKVASCLFKCIGLLWSQTCGDSHFNVLKRVFYCGLFKTIWYLFYKYFIYVEYCLSFWFSSVSLYLRRNLTLKSPLQWTKKRKSMWSKPYMNSSRIKASRWLYFTFCWWTSLPPMSLVYLGLGYVLLLFQWAKIHTLILRAPSNLEFLDHDCGHRLLPLLLAGCNSIIQLNLKRLLFWASLLTCGFGMTQLILITRKNLEWGIPNETFIVCDNLIIVMIAELTSIPLIIYASRICPKNVEGTMYAIITSTNNFGGLLSAMIGGSLTNYYNITQESYYFIRLC